MGSTASAKPYKFQTAVIALSPVGVTWATKAPSVAVSSTATIRMIKLTLLPGKKVASSSDDLFHIEDTASSLPTR